MFLLKKDQTRRTVTLGAQGSHVCVKGFLEGRHVQGRFSLGDNFFRWCVEKCTVLVEQAITFLGVGMRAGPGPESRGSLTVSGFLRQGGGWGRHPGPGSPFSKEGKEQAWMGKREGWGRGGVWDSLSPTFPYEKNTRGYKKPSPFLLREFGRCPIQDWSVARGPKKNLIKLINQIATPRGHRDPPP